MRFETGDLGLSPVACFEKEKKRVFKINLKFDFHRTLPLKSIVRSILTLCETDPGVNYLITIILSKSLSSFVYISPPVVLSVHRRSWCDSSTKYLDMVTWQFRHRKIGSWRVTLCNLLHNVREISLLRIVLSYKSFNISKFVMKQPIDTVFSILSFYNHILQLILDKSWEAAHSAWLEHILLCSYV